MKKRIKYFFMVFLLLINISSVYALSVSKNDITIEKGGSERIELYANVEADIKRVDFTLVFSTYDIPAAFIANSALIDTNPDGITHSVTLPEAKSGKILLGTVDITSKQDATETAGSVSIHTASATTTSDERVSLNPQTINIKLGTPEPTPTPTEKPSEPSKPSESSGEVDKGLLAKIESKLVDIELKKNTFTYTVELKDNKITELDLKPIAKDDKTKVEISTQKIKELKNNKIIITATNGDTKQTYSIRIKRKNDVVIDKGEFKADKSYKTKWIIMSVILLIALAGSIILTKKK